MRALVDGDVLLYEVGFSSQRVNEDGVLEPYGWDKAQEILDHKIALICDEVEATEPPLIFLTNTPRINKLLNKRRKVVGDKEKEYVQNFRIEAAKEKDYKAGRASEKPYHFYNLLAYMLGNYECCIDETGLEADDMLCITQYSRVKAGKFDTTICSRDKDVRQCPGWHYSWEVGKQASIGPLLVDELGVLEIKKKGSSKKLFGTGDKFFYAQMLTGDGVDNIGGLKGRGLVFAHDLLCNAKSSRQLYELVAEKYVQAHGDSWKEKFREQADLLWMIREVNEDGTHVKWTPPKRVENESVAKAPTSD